MSGRGLWALGLTLLAAGCANILGIEDRVLATDGGGSGCTSNSQCAVPDASFVCVLPEGRCADLRSEDCQTVTGEPIPDKAIVIGSLFSTTGSQAATNIARQNAAALAVEEINVFGGVPTSGGKVRLVMVSCDEATNLQRAGNHLVAELKVPAIVGPNTSQDTIDLTQNMTAAAGTLVMSPTAVAASIIDLPDNDLTWRLVPSDVQRAPLMIKQINDIETQLKGAPTNLQNIKLGIIWRNDALGKATFESLNAMSINGKPLSHPDNTNYWKSDAYDYTASDQKTIVDKYVAFKPDIIAAIGTAEVITKIMQPIEASWGTGRRPHYVLIDSGKLAELKAAVTASAADLRTRVRGTGVAPTSASEPVLESFYTNYTTRYNGANPRISGTGPSYDAVYAIAFAIAHEHDKPITGANIAAGLRHLTGGSMAAVQVGSSNVLAAFGALSGGEDINALGTHGPLEWNPKGDVTGSLIEMWCVGSSPVEFGKSGLTYNTKTETYSGSYTQCP